ncbi:MAG: hypothetical protein ACFFB5_15005 [Promethearchaeota archaeon]
MNILLNNLLSLLLVFSGFSLGQCNIHTRVFSVLSNAFYDPEIFKVLHKQGLLEKTNNIGQWKIKESSYTFLQIFICRKALLYLFFKKHIAVTFVRYITNRNFIESMYTLCIRYGYLTDVVQNLK